ncbi:MAG: DEAD/DEAH box helicase family protein [Sarcina sp.]
MHLSEYFTLQMKENTIPIIAAGTGCGKSTYVYNKLSKDLGINESNILMLCHLNAMKGQQLKEEKEVWYGDTKVAVKFNFNNEDNGSGDLVNVTDYHSFNKYIEKSYDCKSDIVLKKKGIKCIVVDEAHELLYSSNYRDLFHTWHFLMETDLQVIFLSATPNILLQNGVNAYNKQFEVVVKSKSDIKIEELNIYNMQYIKNDKSRYREVRRLINKYTINKSFVLINNKRLINSVLGELNHDSIGMWSTFENNYTEDMARMRNSIIEEEKYIEGINNMLTTSAYGTGINISDESVDTSIIFFYSVESLVQNVSRLRRGIKRLVVVKDDINWMVERLCDIKNDFENFIGEVEKNKSNPNQYFATIYKQLEKQKKSKDDIKFIILDEKRIPIFNDNLLASIDYMISQISNIDNIKTTEELKNVLNVYFDKIEQMEDYYMPNKIEIEDFTNKKIFKKYNLEVEKYIGKDYMVQDDFKEFLKTHYGLRADNGSLVTSVGMDTINGFFNDNNISLKLISDKEYVRINDRRKKLTYWELIEII